MPDLPSYAAEQNIQRLREIGPSGWICQGRPTYPPWEGPEDLPFTIVTNTFVRGAPAAVVSFLFGSEIAVGISTTELGSLNTWG